jgi:transcriptional regulator with XRE-family HTH domain
MEKLSSTLKYLLNEANISEAELARRTGIAQPMVNRLATGKNKNPKLETLKPIAKYFSITFSQLLGEEELPSTELRSNQYTTSNNQSFELCLLTIDEINPDNLRSEIMIPTTAKVSNKAFAVLINNDNLEPRFSKNTLLIIDPATEYTANDFVLIKNEVNNKTTLTQVKTDNQANTVLQSLEDDKTIYNVNAAEVKILGVLTQAKHDFK